MSGHSAWCQLSQTLEHTHKHHYSLAANRHVMASIFKIWCRYTWFNYSGTLRPDSGPVVLRIHCYTSAIRWSTNDVVKLQFTWRTLVLPAQLLQLCTCLYSNTNQPLENKPWCNNCCGGCIMAARSEGLDYFVLGGLVDYLCSSCLLLKMDKQRFVF